jgi:CTP synthase
VLSWTGEVKTKPTQHSVNELKRAGLVPDGLFLRTDQHIDAKARAKVALFCGMAQTRVFEVLTVQPLFRLFTMLEEQGVVREFSQFFDGLSINPIADLAPWQALINKIDSAIKPVSIGLVVKYAGNNDPYISVIEAIRSAANHEQVKPCIVIINAELLEKQDEQAWQALREVDGIVVPGGFDLRGAEGKMLALKFARENNIPCLGLCLGFQLMLVEAARSLLGLAGATSMEFDAKAEHPIICLLDEQEKITHKGGTMRLGEYNCAIVPGTLAAHAYEQASVLERHRHRYEFNNVYRQDLEAAGVVFSGVNEERQLVEIAEIKDHSFMVGTQFHPEFKSTYVRPHPLFKRFIQAANKQSF